MNRRSATIGLSLLALLLLACEGGAVGGPAPSGPAHPPKDAPSSMVALGDSISNGFGSCLTLSPCLRNSWSTGEARGVNSHYRRIAAQNKAMTGHARNLAVAGATSADLVGQATAAVNGPADYVTIMIGANDACRPAPDQMTGVRTFRGNVDRALAVLKQGQPKAKILIVSVPDVYRVWEVGHTNPVATRVWSLGVCPSLLANPTSTADADAKRRAAFRDRVEDYDTQLAQACRAYGSRCRTDHGAVHAVAFSATMLSAADFFHPNADGQTRLARVSYPETFNW